MPEYPPWVTSHKKAGTAISCIRGKYYLSAVTSKWNKEKGRAQKITTEYLGRITEQDGFIPKQRSLQAKVTHAPTVKEYGATAVVYEMSEDIRRKLTDCFGTTGLAVYAIALVRLLGACPFKRVDLHYQNSYLSELLPALKLLGKDISGLLSDFGCRRTEMVDFMTSSIGAEGYILFDSTSIVSQSQEMDINRKGYDAHMRYHRQINLMYAFTQDDARPAYYRVVAGNIRDVSSIKICLRESGIKNMVMIADKGFYSQTNIALLQESGLKYIIPLRRSSCLIDYSRLELPNRGGFEDYFMHRNAPVWYYRLGDVILYQNLETKAEEEKSYMHNIASHIEGYSKDTFLEAEKAFGTIALVNNLDASPQQVYALYKQRGAIEQSFDFLKNLLSQDKSYMHNERSLESWAFINHITLLLCYRIYNLLRVKEVISKYSVADFLEHLKYITKIKLNGEWVTSEICKKSQDLLAALELHIT